MIKDWGSLSNPPVWEVGLSAWTATPSIYDVYQIGEIHGGLQQIYPRAERQPPLPAPVKLPMPPPPGAPTTTHTITIQTPPHDQTRWWFISPDGHNLVQLQENYLAVNWRRLESDSSAAKTYPNFSGLRDSFLKSLEIVRNVRHGESFPEPYFAQLFYLNQISMIRDSGSESYRIRDICPFIQFDDDIPKSGLALNWTESKSDAFGDAIGFVLQIAINFGGIWIEGNPHPTAMINLSAQFDCESWEQVGERGDVVHEYIRERLDSLTSDGLKATWV